MKRDSEGKFALKDEEHRLVRSLRLTDSTWEKLGVAAQSSGMTRADWLEELLRRNNQPSPRNTRVEESIALPDVAKKGFPEKAEPSEQVTLSLEDLEVLCKQVLKDLRLGKQASGYKSAQKVLQKLLLVAHRRGNFPALS